MGIAIAVPIFHWGTRFVRIVIERVTLFVVAGLALLTALFANAPPALAAGQTRAVTVEPRNREPVEPRWFKTSFLDIREDIGEASQSGRRLMLYFHQDGCPYCARLLRDNFGKKTIADRTQRDFDVVSINIWGDRDVRDLDGTQTTEKAFARALRVQFTPTLLILDEQRQVATRINGYLPPAQFIAALDRAAPPRPVGANAALRGSDDVVTEIIRSDATDPPPPLSRVGPPLQLGERLARNPRPLLVVFTEPRCPTCSEMRNDGFRRPEVARLLRRFHVVHVDRTRRDILQTPAGEVVSMRDWARSLNISYAPTLAFFDTAGHEVFRIDAYLRAFHVASALEYVVSGAYRTQPEFQRFIETRASERRARGEKVELMR